MNNRFLARDAGAVSILEVALAFLISLPFVPPLAKLGRSALGMEVHTMAELSAKAWVALASIAVLMAVSVLMNLPLRRERNQAQEVAFPARTLLLMMAFLSVQATVLGAWVAAEGFNAARAGAAGLLFALTAAAAVLAFHRLARKAMATA